MEQKKNIEEINAKMIFQISWEHKCTDTKSSVKPKQDKYKERHTKANSRQVVESKI